MNFPIILMFLQILALSLGPLPALNKQILFCCYLQKLAFSGTLEKAILKCLLCTLSGVCWGRASTTPRSGQLFCVSVLRFEFPCTSYQHGFKVVYFLLVFMWVKHGYIKKERHRKESNRVQKLP